MRHVPMSTNRSSGSQSKNRPGSSRWGAGALACSVFCDGAGGPLLAVLVGFESHSVDAAGGASLCCDRTADGDHFSGVRRSSWAGVAWSLMYTTRQICA